MTIDEREKLHLLIEIMLRKHVHCALRMNGDFLDNVLNMDIVTEVVEEKLLGVSELLHNGKRAMLEPSNMSHTFFDVKEDDLGEASHGQNLR